MKSHLNPKHLFLIALALCVPLMYGCSDNPADGTPDGEYAEIENSIHAKINAYRASKGLPALSQVSVMVTQARLHSSSMVSRNSLDHNGFEDRVEEIQKSVAIGSAAENVAFNGGFADPAEEAVQGWLGSTGHRTNIEGDYNVTGIGVERNAAGDYYFT